MADIEKQMEASSSSDDFASSTEVKADDYYEKSSYAQRFFTSFKPAIVNDIDTTNLTATERAAVVAAETPLSRELSSRHIQMIAIGGSIGTGLFVGSGQSLAEGGPASLIIAYGLIGTMIYCTIQSLGELAVRFPVSGSFASYATRFLDPAWGFAMGWNYVLQWLVTLPLELVAASMTLQFWATDPNSPAAYVSPAVWVTVFWVFVVGLNLFGVKGYGEGEFVFGLLKVLAVIGFCILGLVLTVGGGPNHEYLGGRYWRDPGPFNDGFKGLCTVFAAAAFSFSGSELIGLTAAETKNPRKTLPTAAKQVFWRITLFYLISLTFVGLLVPYDDDLLLNGSGASASPFVIAINNAGISGLPSVFNSVVLISTLSVGNSSVYAASRTMVSMAQAGQGPKFLAYIDRKGRPLVGIAVTSVFGLIAYCAVSSKEDEVFTWLMSISGLSAVFTWMSICLSHLRFRKAFRVQGHSLDELAFSSSLGIWGSWYGLLLNSLVLIGQFWTALFPTKSADALNFFEIYLAAPVTLAFYIAYKLWYRNGFVRSKDMDVTTGCRELDIDALHQELEEERMALAQKNVIYRTYKIFC